MHEPEGVISSARLRVSQIIAGSLIAGVVIFLLVVLYLVHVQNQGRGNAPAKDIPILSLIAAGMLATLAPMSLILPRFLNQVSLGQLVAGTWKPPEGANPAAFGTVTDKLMSIYQTTLIVRLAMLEGAAFMGVLAYLQEAQPWVLGLVAAVLALMALTFPTRGRAQAWLESQADMLGTLRGNGG